MTPLSFTSIELAPCFAQMRAGTFEVEDPALLPIKSQ